MTYGDGLRDCSGSCSEEWALFAFCQTCHGLLIQRFQSLKRPLHRFRRRMHIFLTHRDAAVPHSAHERESVRARLTQASAEGMPQGVYHEVFGQPKQVPHLAMEVVKRRD